MSESISINSADGKIVGAFENGTTPLNETNLNKLIEAININNDSIRTETANRISANTTLKNRVDGFSSEIVTNTLKANSISTTGQDGAVTTNKVETSRIEHNDIGLVIGSFSDSSKSNLFVNKISGQNKTSAVTFPNGLKALSVSLTDGAFTSNPILSLAGTSPILNIYDGKIKTDRLETVSNNGQLDISAGTLVIHTSDLKLDGSEVQADFGTGSVLRVSEIKSLNGINNPIPVNMPTGVKTGTIEAVEFYGDECSPASFPYGIATGSGVSSTTMSTDTITARFIDSVTALDMSHIKLISDDIQNILETDSYNPYLNIKANSIDVEAELEKLSKDLAYYEGFKQSVLKKLSNERFVNNAPEAVVEGERKKLADAETKIKNIAESIAALKK